MRADYSLLQKGNPTKVKTKRQQSKTSVLFAEETNTFTFAQFSTHKHTVGANCAMNELVVHYWFKTYNCHDKLWWKIHRTKLGDMPRATAAPPIVYSRIKAQPINQATLEKFIVRVWSVEEHQVYVPITHDTSYTTIKKNQSRIKLVHHNKEKEVWDWSFLPFDNNAM